MSTMAPATTSPIDDSAFDRSVMSTTQIREHFPALQRKDSGNPVAYFDGPGGTQVPRAVVEAMADYLYHHNANTHWEYPTSAETDALLMSAREALADFLGGAPNEIAFGANMTTLLFHIARAMGRKLSPGDEIVVTELDHHANVAPWQALAKERGVVLRWIPLDTVTFQHAEGAFEETIGPRTRIVAIGAASNALGTITDVARIVARARDLGAISVVDAVHYAPHSLVDARAIDADFLLCSAYKFYGPHIGVMRGRYESIAQLDLPRLEPAPDWVPECIETGTQNHEGMVGAAAAVDFLASLATGNGLTRRERLATTFAALHQRGDALFRQMWNGLTEIEGVTLYGTPPGSARTPTIAFRVQRYSADAVTRFLAARGVYVSHGDFYATTVIRRLGFEAEGVVRAGCACYTTADEVARLVEGVRALAQKTA